MINTNSHFDTLRCIRLLYIQFCLLMSLIIWTTNQTGHNFFKPKIKTRFILMFERKIQIWPKVLVKNLTLQCTRMQTHTEACFPCKLTKTDNFPSILVTSIHETDSFWLYRFQWDSHTLQMLSSVFYQRAVKHLHFSHTEVILIIKCHWLLGSLLV